MVMDYNYNYNYNYNHNYNHKYYYKKKAKDENFNGGSNWRSQNYNKSSFSNGVGRPQQSMLSLEKKFCQTVGGVTWQKVLDTQKYMYQDEKVLNWKDSAVQESFWNAKKRFMAKMLGEPCDIQLPDPDIFIDEIDWNSDVDPKLMQELDNRDSDTFCEDDRKNRGVVIGIPVVPEQYAFTPMGWGDVEEGNQPLENPDRQNDTKKDRAQVYDHWGDEGVKKDCSKWYDHWDDDGVNNASNSADVPYDKYLFYVENRHNNHGGSAWNGHRNKQWEHRNSKKSSYGGGNTSRYKTSPDHYNRNDQPLIDDYGNRNRGSVSNSERPPLVQWRPVLRQR